MKPYLLGIGLALSTLGAGCVGTGPNTQQGAVTGGALGALAGAIIGNNSGGNGFAGALIGGTAGAIAGGTLGNQADNQRGNVYERQGYQGQAYAERPPVYRRYKQVPPPPAAPVEAVTAPPAANAVWRQGYWMYDGYRYTWVGGRWEIPGYRS